jgi:outer membrane cobalamin receptor
LRQIENENSKMSKSFLAFLLSLLFIALFSVNLFAQDIVVKGKVRNANTHLEISQANIYIAEIQIGTTSDNKGNFALRIPQKFKDSQLIFEHVAYFPLKIVISKASSENKFNLTPRVIQLPNVQVEAQKEKPAILKDIPQPITLIEAKEFESRGYVDAGDLLKIDQSIQVKEEITGKKTIALRGGNPDDVVVLYNGIRLNNIFDNIFDVSLINLEDIKYFSVIKGSNSALYGAEAVSGVINIVPKTHRNYKIRFQQKLGTYAAGDWNIQLNEKFNNRINLSYSYKQGSSTRTYQDSLATDEFYENKNVYHTATLDYNFSNTDLEPSNKLSLMYFHSDLDYKNSRLNETLGNLNQLFTARFTGDLLFLNRLNVHASYRRLNNEQDSDFSNILINKHILNDAINFNFENTFTFPEVELLLAYQFENGELDYSDKRPNISLFSSGIESVLMSQKKYGAVSILKWHVPTKSEFYKKTDIDVSFRRDYAYNTFDDIKYLISPSSSFAELKAKDWQQSLLKFSSHLEGGNEVFNINAYLTYGSNYKIPTMFQQISIPESFGNSPVPTRPNLKPEENNSTELGVELLGELPNDLNLTGWQFSANYFRNSYNNKLRTYYMPGIPIAFYDNVKNADISGFETKGGLFFYQKKLSLEAGTSIYSISEKAAFPFKSDKKFTVNLGFEHAGFSLQVFWFKESDQTGWIRDFDGNLIETSLDGHSNIDVHVNKSFELFKTKLFANFSGRNLLDDDTKFNGIAIRDRRFYFTFGAQY